MLKSAYTSPKIHALARRLAIPFPHALGISGLLWNFTCDHAPDGNVGKHGALGIATATHWDGDSNALVDALVAVRLIDVLENGEMVIHQWEEHCPQWVKNKNARGGAAPRSDPGRTRVGPRVDPPSTGGRTRVDGGSLTITSLSEVSPTESSLTESPAAAPESEDASLQEGEKRLTEDQIAAIAKSPRKAPWLKAVNRHCSPTSVNRLYLMILAWHDGDEVWQKYEAARAGASKAKNAGAYWAACVRNANKEMRGKR